MNQATLKHLIRPILSLFGKHPKLLLLLPVIGALWYGYETQIARPAMSYMGVPVVQTSHDQQGWAHVLRNQGYMLEYSEGLKNPLWVTYQVSERQFKPGKRPGFKADWRTLSRVDHGDYTRSGYDRGHMAPNYVIASRYGKPAQHETFLMTNITPQKPKLNQKSWQRFEEVIANDFSKWHGDFWVVTGPVFAEQPKRLKSGVAVPKAFYKILVKPGTAENPPTALAMLFPQNAKPKASLMKFVTTIDAIEEKTGIDFFHQLEDGIESRLESSKMPEAWRLPEVAKRPSRY